MTDILIRKHGAVGRITLDRPDALNALTYKMVTAIEAALDDWKNDAAITMLVIDAFGDRAFCAGGDIAEMYATASRGDFAYGRRFWRDEYRMNAKLFNFPKPVAAFMQGFTMGGGVGIGCHGSHRVVGDTSRIAMPECGIGLVPDVGGSLVLARAPGRLGEYLGVTSARMGPGDAIHAGFADYYIPESDWPDLINSLEISGDWQEIDSAARPAPAAPLVENRPEIDRLFRGETLMDIMIDLRHADTPFAAQALTAIGRNSPLSMACTVELVHRVRTRDRIDYALQQEYRFTHRSASDGDFIEGIRARIIDKDNAPKWRHDRPEAVAAMDMSSMLFPLGEAELKPEDLQ